MSTFVPKRMTGWPSTELTNRPNASAAAADSLMPRMLRHRVCSVHDFEILDRFRRLAPRHGADVGRAKPAREGAGIRRGLERLVRPDLHAVNVVALVAPEPRAVGDLDAAADRRELLAVVVLHAVGEQPRDGLHDDLPLLAAGAIARQASHDYIEHEALAPELPCPRRPVRPLPEPAHRAVDGLGVSPDEHDASVADLRGEEVRARARRVEVLEDSHAPDERSRVAPAGHVSVERGHPGDAVDRWVKAEDGARREIVADAADVALDGYAGLDGERGHGPVVGGLEDQVVAKLPVDDGQEVGVGGQHELGRAARDGDRARRADARRRRERREDRAPELLDGVECERLGHAATVKGRPRCTLIMSTMSRSKASRSMSKKSRSGILCRGSALTWYFA